jgi:AraC-like DNA-binding protein
MTLLIDTSSVPAVDRPIHWADEACKSYHPLHISVSAHEAFSARMWSERLSSVRLYRIIAGANTMTRTSGDIAAGDPDSLHLSLMLRGGLEGVQHNRSVLLHPGDMAVYDTSHPVVYRAQAPFDLLVLQISKGLLGRSATTISRQASVRIPGDGGLPKLAARFFRDLMAGLTDGSIAQEDPGLQDHVIDLVRRLYVDLGVSSHPTRPRCAAELLLNAQAQIEARLDDPDLKPEHIARACFISTRYLHRVFAGEGLSVCDFIRTTRLERCRRDLQDPAFADQPIGAIAGRWGLVNPAHFSRLFREAYGCSPREFRRGGWTGELPDRPGQSTGPFRARSNESALIGDSLPLPTAPGTV